MAKKNKSEEPNVSLRAQSIECRLVGENLTMEPVNFQIDIDSEADEPLLVIFLDALIYQSQVLRMLKAIVARIQSDDIPEMKIVLPGEIVRQLDGIFERIRELPHRLRDGVTAYVDEQLGAVSSGEVDDE